jgi:hypothetical protein
LNFYAHLVAASWQSENSEFALGSMLPDFASMASFRLQPDQVGTIAEGVAYHHHSDKAFHGLAAFREQERWTLEHLLSAGLRRGPARGVAHVGVELCLDGALIGRADALYLSALDAAQGAPLRWESPGDGDNFSRLITRLREIGVPHGYNDPSVVTKRLIQIFGPRPLLALQEEETPLLLDAMPAVHKRVADASEKVMSGLRAKL